MENRTVKVGIRHDMMDKPGERQRKLTGQGWENAQLTVKQLMAHIGNGFPITHHFVRGHRKTENFLGAEILIADIDVGLTLDEAKVHPFITSYATLLYTTASHTDANHRFRVVFVMERQIVESRFYTALYKSLMQEIPTDPSTKSCATLFFGNRHAIFHWIGKSLPEGKINEMIKKGLEEQNNSLSSTVTQNLAPDIQVNVKNKGLQSLITLNYGTSVHCPFGTHQDKKPSAFVKVNSRGIRGVQCRSCDQSAWMESSAPYDDGVGYFHRKVLEFAGQANPTAAEIPQGLERCFPDLENSLAESNYHLSNSSRFSLSKIVPGINLIKSAKGTGKTYVLSKLVEQSKDPLFRKKHGMGDGKGILIGHRQSLIQESAKKLGMECYLDTGDIDTQPRWSKSPPVGITTCKPQYYAICLDTLIIGKKGQPKPRTDIENARLERFFLKKFYNQEITEDLIEFDEEGKTREKLKRLALLTDPKFVLQKYEDIPHDLRLMKSSKGKFASIKSINEAVFLREAFGRIGIYDWVRMCLNPNVTYGSAKLGPFIVFMDNNRERFAQVFNKEVNRRLFDRPTSQIRSLLKLVGLYQEQVKYNKGGNRGGATFKLEPDRLQEMMEIVVMRAKIEGKAQTEEDSDLLDDVG